MRTFVYNSNNIEYKSYFDEKTKTQRHFLKGFVTTSDIDLVNDKVTYECIKDIDEQLSNRNIKLDLDHETLRLDSGQNELEKNLNITRIPLGKKAINSFDEKGNFVEFELNSKWKKLDSKGDIVFTFEDVLENIKNGFYDAFSIAYSPVKTSYKNINGVNARMLDKINIINIALTGNPINPNARMTEVFAKSLDYIGEFEDLKVELREINNKIGDIMKKENKSDEEKQTPVSNNNEVVEEKPKEEAEIKKDELTESKEENVNLEETEVKSFVEEKSFILLKSRIDNLEKTFTEFLEKINLKSKGVEEKRNEVVTEELSRNTLQFI
jgi:hypothetical protein